MRCTSSLNPTGVLSRVRAYLTVGDRSAAVAELVGGQERFNGLTILNFLTELQSLIDGDLADLAIKRIDGFLNPKWSSVAVCRAAYDAAMAEKRARAA